MNEVPKDLFLPVHGPERRLQTAERADTSDGIVRIKWFPLGFPQMDDEDWRQFEITPENALKMTERANAKLAAGKKIRLNYGHNGMGPKSGEATRFEADTTGVYGFVKWTPAARAAIKSEPSEWDGFSPEFFAERVMNEEDRRPVMYEGREVLRPDEITGGALTNMPAMPDLGVAANKATSADADARIGNAPSAETAKNEEIDMALPKETLARLGLAEDAGPEDVDKKITELTDKLAELTKPPEAVPPPPAQAAAGKETSPTGAAVAEMIAAGIKEADEKRAHEQRITAALKLALESGKITAAMKPGAEKFAAADIEAFEKFVEAAPVLAPVGKFGASGEAPAKVDPLLRHPSDHVGIAASSYDPQRFALHQNAIAYMDRAKAAGKTITYRAAVEALTRKSA
jgi:hypothetical protein